MEAPFKCPLSNCSDNVSSSTLLSHLLKVHKQVENGISLKEFKAGERISLMVPMNESYLELGKSVCLGVLVCSMEKAKHSNELLSVEYEDYQHHVPVLIMACRGNYIMMFESDDAFVDPHADFLALWLVAPQIKSKKKIAAKLTIFDRDVKTSSGSLLQIRHSQDSQDIKQFMHSDTDFLLVNSGFLQRLTQNRNFFIEISDIECLFDEN